MKTNASSLTALKDVEAQIQQVHAPFFPAEVFSGEQIDAELSIHAKTFKLQVWRISPLGVELVLPMATAEALEVSEGEVVGLRMRINEQMSDFRGLVVKSRYEQDGRSLIGIRWSESSVSRVDTGNQPRLERRKTDRWLCGNEFMPNGVAPNPARFNDFVYFKVKDISNQGFLLITSMRNRYLIPGIRLHSSISFPMCAQLNIQLRITSSRALVIDGKEQLALGVQMENVSKKTLSTIGQYIFQFGPKTTIEDLRAAGFNVPTASQGLDFGFARTDEDYQQVLTLRRDAYELAGKIPKGTPIEAMSDAFDSRSRILTVRHRGEMVGSLRMIFHGPDDKFEVENHVALPIRFPRKDEAVEISRLCTHPKFRESDIFYAIAKRTMITVAQSKRKWIVSFASPKLLPLYQKIGANGIGVKFAHAGLNGQEHEVITWDIANTLTGKSVNPIVWNALFYDMTNYIWDQDLVEYDPMLRVRLAFYKLFRPITPFMLSRIKKQK